MNIDDAIALCRGKTITGITLDDEMRDDQSLRFVLDGGATLRIYDGGQSCCEARYMRTDDDLGYFVGATLIDVEAREGPEEEGEYGDMHEVRFLVVTTDRGVFTMANHNKHNGYYGGFHICAAVES
jgi:hypothetical protein